MGFEVGQVLSLRIRFNNQGEISQEKHPCLIVEIDKELSTIEIVQFSSLENKKHKAINKYNKIVMHTKPKETVIDKDSFAQLNNRFTIDLFDELTNYRRQEGKLSTKKLLQVLGAYEKYRFQNEIDENRIVHMDKEEIIRLNS